MIRMPKMAMGVICIGVLTGCSSAKRTAATPAPNAAAATAPGGEGIQASSTTTATATVTAVNQKKRLVTLRGSDGEQATFKVGPEVKNFAQVRKGDEVTATYYEAIAVRLKKPGEATPGITAAEDVLAAEPGQKPAGAGATTVTITATVVKVDRKKQVVTLKGPKGRVVPVTVKDPARLEKVKVGDLVEITYTEAVAIAVEKASR